MTRIEWTDATWNPVTGCSPVSAGCANCYAVKRTRRLARIAPSHLKYDGLVDVRTHHFNGTVRTHPDELQRPLRWYKPRMVFVCKMSDLFHPSVPFAFIDRVFAIMAQTPQHTYQVLTKRPERMATYFFDVRRDERIYDAQGSLGAEPRRRVVCGPLPNVWLGTSCEDQDAADERIPYLLQCPAAVRFVSLEPLLGPIELGLCHGCRGCNHPGNIIMAYNEHGRCSVCDGTGQEPSGIDWVIVGGESGPKARPCDVDWIRSIVRQCREAGTPCFVKQLGANARVGKCGGAAFELLRLRDSKGADPSEWPEDLRVREWPEVKR